MSRSRISGVFFLTVLLWADLVSARVWTTTSGNRSEGELIDFEDNRVTLRIQGRDYTFPISRFSAGDRAYLANWKLEPRCGVCKKIVGAEKMQAGERVFHPTCFTCLVCERPFLDRQPIRRDEWGGMVHAEHFRQALSCGSCSRLMSRKRTSSKQMLRDGRVSCVPCLQEAVSEVSTLNAVANRVRQGMSELGLPRPVGPLTMRLVSQNQLNQEVERLHGRGSLRGLTLTTFRTITGGPDAGTTFSHEVWVLAGLPVVECLSVLAHEFGHVWLNENYIEMSPPAVEGFCNLLSMHALKKETSKLADILRKNLQMSDDRVYGRGFREMDKRLQSLGWPGLIRDLSSRKVPLHKRAR
ncbi:MAG: protein DA1 [Opitutae bacterium]|nr:protein DA1 [Opitutae bacterium]